MTKSWKISRRTLLRGLGATLALPAGHVKENLPVILAGKGQGRIATGQHLVCKEHTPLADLHLTLVQKLDLKLDEFNGATQSTIAGI
jgi:hypothetical protein